MKFIRTLILCFFLTQYSTLSETLFKSKCGELTGQIYHSKEKSLLVVPFLSGEGISCAEINFDDIENVKVDRIDYIVGDDVLYYTCIDNHKLFYYNFKGEFYAVVKDKLELLRPVPGKDIVATTVFSYWIFSDEHSLYPNLALSPKLKLLHLMNISPKYGLEILCEKPISKTTLFPGADFFFSLEYSVGNNAKVYKCVRGKEGEGSECLPSGMFPYGRAFMGASLEVNGKPALVWHDKETAALCLAYYDDVEMKWSNRHVILPLKKIEISESVFAGSFIVSENQFIFCFNDDGEISGGALNLLTGKKRIWKIRSISPNNYLNPFLSPTKSSNKFIFGYYNTGDIPARTGAFDELELNIELIECDVGEWQDI